MMKTAPRIRVRGINNDHDTCSHCGKTGLKRVVWCEYLDAEGNGTGDVEPIGTSCAARLLRTTTTRVTRSAEAADREAERQRQNEVHFIGEQPSVCDWIIESIGQNGNSITRLCLANGRKSLVERWAEERWPHQIIEVRRPSGRVITASR
jgi:hypothetical protein